MIYLWRRILAALRVIKDAVHKCGGIYRKDFNKSVTIACKSFEPACNLLHNFSIEAGSNAGVHILLAILLFFFLFLLQADAEKLPEWKLNYLQLCVKWRARFSPPRQIIESSREQLGWSFPMLEVLRERIKRCQQRRGHIKLLRSHFPRARLTLLWGWINNARVTQH